MTDKQLRRREKVWDYYYIGWFKDSDNTLCKRSNGAFITYKGVTMDLEHRLRQHNQEIVGGAVYTSRFQEAGKTWKFILTVGPFLLEKDVKAFEIASKTKGKKLRVKYCPAPIRDHIKKSAPKILRAIFEVLHMTQWSGSKIASRATSQQLGITFHRLRPEEVFLLLPFHVVEVGVDHQAVG